MNRVLGLAREVVAQRLLIIGVITAVLHLVVAMHWVSQSWSDDAVQQITGVLDALGALVAGVVIRRAVTPSKDPRADDGEPLMRVDEHIAALHEAARVQAHPSPHTPEHAAPTTEGA